MTDRGASVAFGYVLSLAIAAMLVTGLLVAGGNFLDDTRQQVARQELDVVGQHVASNVEMADRLVEAGNDTTTVALEETFPEQVTGSPYRVSLVEDSGGQLHLNATDPSVSVAIRIDNTTAVRESHAGGGDVAVVYNATAEVLVLRDG